MMRYVRTVRDLQVQETQKEVVILIGYDMLVYVCVVFMVMKPMFDYMCVQINRLDRLIHIWHTQ